MEKHEREYIDFCKNLLSNKNREDVVIPTILLRALFIHIFTGELIDHYKRHLFYGTEINQEQVNDLIHDIISTLHGPEDWNHSDVYVDGKLLHSIMGMITEVGEITDEVIRSSVENESIDWVNLYEELGDLQWYEAIFCDTVGTSWSEARTLNMKKLQARYGNQWSHERAVERDLENERKILESKS